ncbi:MAG: extracellular solute-binding protein [Burkholderiaceae bacterium]
MAESPFPKRRRLLTAGAALGAATAAPFIHAQPARKIRILNVESQVDSLKQLRESCARFTKETGIEVEIDTNSLDEMWAKLLASIRAGNPYDIAQTGFIAHVSLLQEQNALMPLSDLTNKHKWGRNILFPIGGEVWWYPYDYNFSMLNYRKDLYAEQGWKPPKTHAEFLSHSKALTDGKGKFGSTFPIGNGGAAQWITSPFFWAEGVRLFDDKWNVIIDSDEIRPRMVRALDFLAELYPTMPPGVSQAGFLEPLQGVLSGNVAHTGFSGAIVEATLRDKSSLIGKIGLAAYPSSDGSHSAINHGYDGFMVLKSRNSDNAMRFMQWFADNAYVDYILSRPLHFQPPRLDVYDDARFTGHPWVKAAAEEVKFMRSVAETDTVIIRSIDTEGPTTDKRAGKAFESWAFPRMIQERLLRKTPASQCVDIGAKILRQAIAG